MIRLHIRGISYEDYTRVARRRLQALGGAVQDMAPAKREQVGNLIAADAYILGWEGIISQKGSPIPYNPEALAMMMDADPALFVFVTQNANRLSPPWPDLAA